MFRYTQHDNKGKWLFSCSKVSAHLKQIVILSAEKDLYLLKALDVSPPLADQ
jgi:hypothetical protein